MAGEVTAPYFWATTLQWVTAGGSIAVKTVTGYAPLPSSADRRDAFERVLSEARRMVGLTPGYRVAVLFFYFEPLALPAGRQS